MTLSKKKLDDLHDKVDNLSEVKKLAKSQTWRGKPIIPLDRWELMLRTNARQALECIPDGYTEITSKKLFNLKMNDEINQTQIEIWREDFSSYLEHIGNRIRGRELCNGCLLYKADDPFGLRKIFADALNSENSIEVIQSSMEKMDTDILPRKHHDVNEFYPCPVRNRFDCPYKSSKTSYNDEGLISLGKKLDSVEAALFFALELTNEIEEEEKSRYKVDFDKDIVSIGPDFDMIDTIKDLPIPKQITVCQIAEIYQVLTNPDFLEKLLSQYFAYENPDYNLKHIRKELVKCVMKYKDKIKIEELRDGYGGIYEDSEEELKRIKKRAEYLAWPSAKCCICTSNICEIKCTSCNLYICKKHWRDHMEQKHPTTAIKYPPPL
jgi:hypothetical protein